MEGQIEPHGVFEENEGRNIFIGDTSARAPYLEPDNYSEFRTKFYDNVKAFFPNKEIKVMNVPVAIFNDQTICARRIGSNTLDHEPTIEEAVDLFVKNIPEESKIIFLYYVGILKAHKADASSDIEIDLIDEKTFLPYQGKGRIVYGIKIRFATL